jgi:hypothetical protein
MEYIDLSTCTCFCPIEDDIIAFLYRRFPCRVPRAPRPSGSRVFRWGALLVIIGERHDHFMPPKLAEALSEAACGVASMGVI